MLPYWAIIKDSFREALASRVLWVLLGLITIVLVALAPLTYRETATTGIRPRDIEGWPLLVEQLKQASQSEKLTPARRVWSLLSPEGQKAIRDFKMIGDKPTMRDVGDLQRTEKILFRALDELLRRDDLYDHESWQDVALSRELEDLHKTPYDKLSRAERLRANRLLLEAAFPDLISSSDATSLRFRYAAWDLGQPVPVRKQQFVEELFKLLPWLIDKGILSIGLLIAVLVTAPIIPQMFDPTSLHLLLSKPITRPLLYLAKFLGGCAFVLLAATYLFVGLWLIIGVQWDIWEPQLLWCIPIYGFVFATYYSVAALAGVVWRNTIVAVILTIVFWGACFAIGFSQSTLGGVIQRYRISRIVPAGDDLFAADEVNTLLVWQAGESNWKPLTTSPEHVHVRSLWIMFPRMPIGQSLVGPQFDEKNQQLVSAAPSFKLFQRMVMVAARKNPEWKATEGPPPSGQPFALLKERDGQPLLITNTGAYRIARDVTGAGTPMLRLPGITLPITPAAALQNAGPSPAEYWGEPHAAALDQSTGDLFVYSRGQLAFLRREGGDEYAVVAETQLTENEREPAVLAAGGGSCYVVFKQGKLWSVPASDPLKATPTGKLPGESPPRVAAVSPDGKRLFVLSHDGKLHVQDLESQKFSLARVRGQGDISALTITNDGKLFLASRATRVSEVDLGTMQELQVRSPPLNAMERSYYYGIQPAHAWLPKPGEFYKTVQYLLVGEETSGSDEQSLATAQDKLDPWSPIWSGLLFQAVMLLLGCLYIQWQEF